MAKDKYSVFAVPALETLRIIPRRGTRYDAQTRKTEIVKAYWAASCCCYFPLDGSLANAAPDFAADPHASTRSTAHLVEHLPRRWWHRDALDLDRSPGAATSRPPGAFTSTASWHVPRAYRCGSAFGKSRKLAERARP